LSSKLLKDSKANVYGKTPAFRKTYGYSRNIYSVEANEANFCWTEAPLSSSMQGWFRGMAGSRSVQGRAGLGQTEAHGEGGDVSGYVHREWPGQCPARSSASKPSVHETAPARSG
jgi:hypothetical protein